MNSPGNGTVLPGAVQEKLNKTLLSVQFAQEKAGLLPKVPVFFFRHSQLTSVTSASGGDVLFSLVLQF